MFKAAHLSVLFALFAGAANGDEEVPKLYSIGGTEITRGDLGFAYTGPTIVSDVNDPGSPSYALATIKTPNENRRLLFLMVLDYGGKQITGAEWSTASRIEGHEITDASTAIIDDEKKLSFAFRYSTDNKSQETFSVNGQVLDDSTPRVFLVDLTGKTPQLTPLKIDLPKDVPDFHSRDAVRKGNDWRKMTDELKNSSPELKTFIEGYGKR